jgi:hypothetical protein
VRGKMNRSKDARRWGSPKEVVAVALLRNFGVAAAFRRPCSDKRQRVHASSRQGSQDTGKTVPGWRPMAFNGVTVGGLKGGGSDSNNARGAGARARWRRADSMWPTAVRTVEGRGRLTGEASTVAADAIKGVQTDSNDFKQFQNYSNFI